MVKGLKMQLSFNKNDWINYGRWVQPTLSGCFWSHWNIAPSVKASFPDVYFHPCLFIDGNTLIHIRDKQAMLNKIAEMDKSKQVEAFIERLQAIGNKTKQNHLEILNKKHGKIEYLETLFDTYADMAGFWWLVLQLSDELEEYLSKNHPNLEQAEMVKIVEALRKPTWLEEQSFGIKKIVKMIKETKPSIKVTEINKNFIKQNPKISKEIKKHVQEFVWFGTHHWGGEAYTKEKCLGEVKKLIEKGLIEKKKELVPKKTNKLLELMAVLSFWRTHCAEVTAKVVFLSRPKMEAIAKENGLSYQEFTYLTSSEILKHLKEGKKLPNKMPERKPLWGSYVESNGIEHVFAGNELQQLLNTLVAKQETGLKEIKGMIASKGGIVQGTVKVLVSPEDFKNFQEGDILVAPETTPDFVPLMKKAKAIITDRGGITSHAAIVSREIGVPCIIGTNNATSALKNGDKVEVDAEKGIVRKIR